MSEPSLFTKIISGEIPAHKIYEDGQTYAFLDIDPLNPGHTLVIPKKQVDQLWDLGDDLYQALMSSVKKVANRQREVLKPERVGLAVEGFAVPHVHVHVFPLYKGLESTVSDHIAGKSKKPDQKALAAMAKKLHFGD